MTTEQIPDYKEAIYQCAKDFSQDANAMMAQLASEFNFEIKASTAFPQEVYRHYNNKGTLKNTWSFYFHGSHCKFEHLHTGQVLEVLHIFRPEFGYISGFELFVYMKTTQKHKWLAEALTEHDVHYAIDMLVKEGALAEVENTIAYPLILPV